MDKPDRQVLLIDDHPLFRLGLRSALGGSMQRLTVHEAATLPAALQLLAAGLRLDLIVYDWRLDAAGAGGVKGLLALLQTVPGVPVIVVSALEDEAVRVAALALGADSFVSKGADAAEVCQAIVELLLQPRAQHRGGGRSLPPCTLTPRQQQVLGLMAKGLANKLIADRLQIAETTVRAHVSEILHLMHTRNRTEAVVLAYRTGMV